MFEEGLVSDAHRRGYESVVLLAGLQRLFSATSLGFGEAGFLA